MSMENRSLVTIDDLSNQEIMSIFSLADEVANSLNEQSSLCQGKIMASRDAPAGRQCHIGSRNGEHLSGKRREYC